jgi:NAD kinase
MGKTTSPRVVLVTRATEYEDLIAHHATHGQAQFFLQSRGQEIEDVREVHFEFQAALELVQKAVPVQWRRTRVDRKALDRFLFGPEDIVVALGQDGLVPNIAKYLNGQVLIGLNPDPSRYDGLLVKNEPAAAKDLLVAAEKGRCECQERVMVQAKLDDGQVLLALNEIFIGHRTHQSAKYVIRYGDSTERHSSSGVVVATGTGSTGWARSISRERAADTVLPNYGDDRLAFFVREAFPSRATGTEISQGSVARGTCLELTSQMNDDGVIFGDGIEDDRIPFPFGARVQLSAAKNYLRLV